MTNPILAIRRKASSFRENRVKPLFVTRQRVVPAEKSTDLESGISHNGTTILVDPDFSLESFLNRLKTTSSVFSSLRRPSAKRPRLTSSIDNLTDGCLESILTHLNQKDVLSARMVCKRLNKIIQKSKLARKSVSRIQLNGDDLGQIYRFTSIRAPHFDEFALPAKCVAGPMRHLKARMITFDNIVIDVKMVHVFEQAVDYTLDEVVFDFCHFNLSDFELGHLLRSWRPRCVSFVNCDWRDATASQMAYISDSLFALNIQLQSFVFSNIGCKKLFVSDRTLQRFSQLPRLPTSFQLAGCTSNITLNGISAAISAYLSACTRPTNDSHLPSSMRPPYLWEFGVIENTTLEDTLDRLAPFLVHGYVAQSSPTNLEIRFTTVSKHLAALYVTISFRPPIPVTLVSTPDTDDIPWDDSDEDDDTES